MLAALCLIPPGRKLFRRTKSVKTDVVSVCGGRYLRITMRVGKDGTPDWTAVRRAAGHESGQMLLPFGVKPPDSSRIRAFSGHALNQKMMTDAAAVLLRKAAIDPRLVCVSVYDEHAVMPDLPLLFLPFASEIRVVTTHADRYERQRHIAMIQYGAVLSIFDDPDRMTGSLLTVAPGGIDGLEAYPVMKSGICLSAIAVDRRFSGLIDGYLPRVPSAIRAALPAGCDVSGFMAGLYELSGVKEAGAHPPEFLRMNGATVPYRDAIKRMAGLDIVTRV